MNEINFNREYRLLAKAMKLCTDPDEKFEIFNTFLEENEETDFFSLLNYLCDKGVVFDSPLYISFAIKNDSLELLEALVNAGCPMDKECCSEAARYGSLYFLTYLHENGCPWNEMVPIFAIQNDDLDCLKYAIENSCKVPDYILRYCIQSKKCKCFRYLIKLGYKVDEKILCEAASSGNSRFLKLSIENGYNLTNAVLAKACKKCHLKCIKLCFNNKCFLTMKILNSILESNEDDNEKVFQYIYNYRDTIPFSGKDEEFDEFIDYLILHGYIVRK